MSAKRARAKKRYFSVAEANAALPLVRSIVRDIVELAHALRERQNRLARLQGDRDSGTLGEAYREELQQMEASIDEDQEKMKEYVQELTSLGVELKDFFMGLVDFPCWMDGREVYLCWRHGEDEVAHWHEVNAGFAGRQKLLAGVSKEC